MTDARIVPYYLVMTNSDLVTATRVKTKLRQMRTGTHSRERDHPSGAPGKGSDRGFLGVLVKSKNALLDPNN